MEIIASLELHFGNRSTQVDPGKGVLCQPPKGDHFPPVIT